MAFWNRKERRANSGLAVPQDWMWDAFGATRTASGQRVTVSKALGLIPIYAAASIIAEHVSQLPFKVYRSSVDGDEVEEARGHRSWRLLHDRPNSWTPAGQFWSTVALHMLLYGNAFIEKLRDSTGVVEELRILSPAEIVVNWYEGLREKTFVFTPADGRPRRELDESECLHIMRMSMDGITGMSPIAACKASLGTALAREEFEAAFYNNGAVLSQALLLDGVLKGDKALENLQKAAQTMYGSAGGRKAHQVAVFQNGVKPHAVGSPMKDLEFVESQNLSATQIAVLFKLPPNALGGSTGEGLTYSTVEMNQQQIAVNAVAPITTTIAQAVSQDPALMPQNVITGEFALEGMMRGDAKTRAEFYKILSEIKAIHWEEVRKRENLPPLTAAQKKDLHPPTPAPLAGEPQDDPVAALAGRLNGNGNGSEES